jgi:hypothetical protein
MACKLAAILASDNCIMASGSDDNPSGYLQCCKQQYEGYVGKEVSKDDPIDSPDDLFSLCNSGADGPSPLEFVETCDRITPDPPKDPPTGPIPQPIPIPGPPNPGGVGGYPKLPNDNHCMAGLTEQIFGPAIFDPITGEECVNEYLRTYTGEMTEDGDCVFKEDWVDQVCTSGEGYPM